MTAPRRRHPSAGAVASDYVRSAEIDPRDLPPGPAISPSEQSLRLLREPEEFLAECGRRYGDSFTVRLSLFPPIVFVSHPRTVEQVFSMDRDKDRFRAGAGNAIQLSPLGPDSIMLLDGERHARMRRLLRNLWSQEYLEIVRRSVRSTLDRWRPGDRISLRSEMERIALDVILRAILGLDEGTQRERVRELLVRWLSAADDVPKFLTSFAPLMKEVDDALYEVIARRRREGGRAQDVLSRLLAARDDDGARLTDQEIRDQVTTLIAAGHDTTATVMAWVFFHLFTEPAVLLRLRDRLSKAAGSGPVFDAYLKRKRTYLSAVLNETMRLHPVVSGVHRMLHRATRIGRYMLPKGVIVAPCIYLAHRRPEVWREAGSFRPERFLDAEIPDGAFFPFGGGVRACLGQDFAMPEMKIVVHEVLQRARLRIDPGYRARAIRRGVTHVPDRGIPAVVLAS